LQDVAGRDLLSGNAVLREGVHMPKAVEEVFGVGHAN
jgi:hypothetical protein